MATPTHIHKSQTLRQLLRLLVVGCAVLMGATLTAPVASADPPVPGTASDAARLVAELGRDLEVLQEEQNEAQVALDRFIADAAAATVALGEVNATLVEIDGRMRGVARSAFAGDRLGSFSAILTADSPQEFLDRVNTLEFISGRDGALLTQATQTRNEAKSLNDAADVAVAASQAAVAEIATRRADLANQIQTFEDLYAQLSAEEQAAAAAAEAAAAEAAAETATSQGDRTDGDPAEGDRSEGDRSEGDRSEGDASRDDRTDGEGSDGNGQAPPGEIAAPSDAARIAVETAYAQLGDRYVFGAGGPDSFDCSGLTSYVYAAAGVNLPHSSRSQSTMGVPVSRSELQPGDLVFAYSPVSHVGIYVGGGQVIHAYSYGSPVSLGSVNMWGAYSGARRITG